MKAKKLIHGAVGLTKAGMGIEHVSDEIYKRRLEICSKCPRKSYKYSSLIKKDVSSCNICGCFIKVKALLKSEYCEDTPSRWYAVK